MDWLFALHTGLLLSVGGSETNGAGEHVEAEALAQPAPWFAIGVVGSYGHYTGTNPDDEGPVVTHTVHVLEGGLRADLQSRYVFFGAGVLGQWRDDAASGFDQSFAGEVLLGGNVAHIGDYRVQLGLGAAASRPEDDWIFDLTLQLGVQYDAHL
jgi:hypothetical protein